MNWDAIGAIGEVIGAAGVIISLLYLAVQIRGDARAKRAGAMHDQSDAYREFLRMLAEDESLSDIYLRGVHDYGSMKGAEQVRFTSVIGFLFRVFDEAFFQWKGGTLKAHVWIGFKAPMDDILEYQGVRDWWAVRSHWYSEPFQEYVNEKIARPGVPRLYDDTGL